MGIGHSSTNLGSDCTRFEAGAKGTTARWGDSFEVGMGNWKENDQTEIWGVEYITGHRKRGCNEVNITGKRKRSCGFQLRANRDNFGVKSIHFGLSDNADNETSFSLDITRVGRDGFNGGIKGIDSSGTVVSFTRAKQDYSIQTTIVSYGCSYRDGLFVLIMKKKTNCENAYMVTMAHYYVTKDVGISVVAKIRRNKDDGFVVEVEGPFKHPSIDLRGVLVKTRRTGIWSPSACSHCKGGNSNNDHQSQQIIQGDFVSRNGRDQFNKGLVNSSGYTKGSGNNSMYFLGCNF